MLNDIWSLCERNKTVFIQTDPHFLILFYVKDHPQTFQLYADLSLYINIKHILILCWQMTNYVHLFSLAIRLFSDGPNYLFFMQLE